MVGGQGSEDVAALEVGDLDEAVLHRQGVVALNLCWLKSWKNDGDDYNLFLDDLVLATLNWIGYFQNAQIIVN